jgi:deazaflavin-dependent oxidoreductase (nitroreductase family)
VGPLDVDAIATSLATERTVDIVTVGRRTGQPRTTEIWTTLVAGDLYVCGTPAAGPADLAPVPRDWLANLLAEPAFTLRLKQSVAVDLPARATPVADADERRRLLAAPQSRYYREHSRSTDDFVAHAPVVRVELVGAAAAVGAALRAARADGPA